MLNIDQRVLLSNLEAKATKLQELDRQLLNEEITVDEFREAMKMSDEYYGTTTYPCISCGVAHPDILPDDPYCDFCNDIT